MIILQNIGLCAIVLGLLAITCSFIGGATSQSKYEDQGHEFVFIGGFVLLIIGGILFCVGKLVS